MGPTYQQPEPEIWRMSNSCWNEIWLDPTRDVKKKKKTYSIQV